MEREIKHFVEEFWIEKNIEGYVSEINSRSDYISNLKSDPFLFLVRFFDREVITIDKKKYIGEAFNYSDFIKVNNLIEFCGFSFQELLNTNVSVSDTKKSQEIINNIIMLDDFKDELLSENLKK